MIIEEPPLMLFATRLVLIIRVEEKRKRRMSRDVVESPRAWYCDGALVAMLDSVAYL